MNYFGFFDDRKNFWGGVKSGKYLTAEKAARIVAEYKNLDPNLLLSLNFEQVTDPTKIKNLLWEEDYSEFEAHRCSRGY